MKTAALLVLLLACQKHDDPLPTSTSASASASVTPVASSAPSATSEPVATASAEPIRDAGVKPSVDERDTIAKRLDAVKLHMLAWDGGNDVRFGGRNRAGGVGAGVGTVRGP